MLAVGAYSGPRPGFGAVAQLARNARHVIAAVRRIDNLALSGLINAGRVQTVGDDSEEVFRAQQVSYKTLGLRRLPKFEPAHQESSDFLLE
jgi:hypothetical protein